MPLRVKLSAHRKKRYQRLFATLRKRRSATDDALAERIHQDVFQVTDCLSCAACCKSHPPLLEGPDIKRISKHLKLSEAAFVGEYLILDEDGDWVFHTVPCPFLQDNNACRIYEHRPKACREYPHTDRRKLYQIESLTIINAEICPAVGPILDRLADELHIP